MIFNATLSLTNQELLNLVQPFCSVHVHVPKKISQLRGQDFTTHHPQFRTENFPVDEIRPAMLLLLALSVTWERLAGIFPREAATPKVNPFNRASVVGRLVETEQKQTSR